MKIILQISLFIYSISISSQNTLDNIYIDYQNLGENLKQVDFIDKLNNGKTTRTIYFDHLGRIKNEEYNGYQYLKSKHKIWGNNNYSYTEENELPYKRLFIYSHLNDTVNYNPKDTLQTVYKYDKAGKLIKLTSFKRASKSRKKWFTPKYGDGTKNGCIIDPKHMKTRYYWDKTKLNKYSYNDKNQLLELKKTNGSYYGGHTISYTYSNGILKTETARSLYSKDKKIDWERTFGTEKGQLMIYQKNFIEKFNQIPPKTTEVITKLSGGKVSERIIKTEFEKILLWILFEYDENDNLTRVLRKNNSGEVILDYEIKTVANTVYK